MSKLSELVLQIQSLLSGKPALEEVFSAESSHFSTKKGLVLDAIFHRAHEVTVEDLPNAESELLSYFEEFKNGDYFNDLQSKDYYRFLDLREKPESRVVIIGDIHCDFNSLSAILLKLSVSSYDFFEKGLFVFMGDYLDRGSMLFEPLLLLMDLKRILGDRMLMLRGNHELISFNEESQQLEGRVIPQDSVPCLNEYCGDNKAFLEAFGCFYKTLPTYCYLKVKEQNVLITHGGVPRDCFLNVFKFDSETGELVFERDFLFEENRKVEENVMDDSLKTKVTKLKSRLLLVRNKILYDMIWGDPSRDEEKYQVSGRFQFGRKQFEAYVQKNSLNRVFRSHEPVDFGYASFFNDRLFTIFSTGGSVNDQSGYGGIEPAFAVVNSDGNFEIENSYIYRVNIAGALDLIVDPSSEEVIKVKNLHKYMLNDEFSCSVSGVLKVLKAFEAIGDAFAVPEEVVGDAAGGLDEEATEEPMKEPIGESADDPAELITGGQELVVEVSAVQDSAEESLPRAREKL